MSSQTVKFEYDPKTNILFTQDDYVIKTKEDVDAFWKLYLDQLERIGKKVHIVTRIDGLIIKETAEDYYGGVARAASEKWLINFARYGDTAVGRVGILNTARKAHFETTIHKTREDAIAAVLKDEKPR